MSETRYLKCGCQHCDGHLEFPADAAGDSVICPHCGQNTELKAGPATRFGWGRMTIGLVLAVILAAAALAVIQFKHQGASPAKAGQTAPAAPMQTNRPAAKPGPPEEATTNAFAVSGIRLERTPGSSLVYVTGKLRNLASHQRFGVKVEFKLFGTNDDFLGKCTDYQSSLDPHGTWKFKALVMESKVATAALSRVQEDQ
jgi:hypothetical protein